MPIVLEQPGPLSPSTSSAYGAALAMKDFAPYLYRQLPRGGGGGGGAGGGGDRGPTYLGGGGGGNGGISVLPADPLDLYRGKMEIDRQERQRQIDLIRQNMAPEDQPPPDQEQTYDEAGTGYVPGPADQPQPAPSPDIVDPGQPGSNTPNAAPPPPTFTPADQMQLSRMQGSQAAIRQQLMTGQIDRATGNAMIMQLQTGINPMLQAQQSARLAMEQQQTQAMQRASAHQEAMEQMTIRMRSTANADGIRTNLPGAEGIPHQWNHPKQTWDVVPGWEAHRTHVEAEQTRQRAADTKEDEDFRKALTEAEMAVLPATTAGRSVAPTEAQIKRIKEIMAQRGFSSNDLGEHQRNRAEGRLTSRISSEVSNQMTQEANGPTRPAWAATPETREDEHWIRTQERLRRQGISSAKPAPEPIPLSTPVADLPAGQRTVMTRLMDFRRRITEEGYTGDSLNRAIDLYRQFGTTEAMPPRIKAWWERNVALWDRAYGPQVQRPAPAPPTEYRSPLDQGYSVGGF